jgi:hypothetical protein
MTILADVSTESLSEGDAVEALMGSFGGPKTPTGAEPKDTGDDAGDDEDADLDEDESRGDEETPDEIDGEDAENADEAPEAKPVAKEAADDAVINVTIDGVTTPHTVASLKRLAGQEASLTRKSQEADHVGGRAAAALQAALEVTMEDLQPYQGIDWLVLQNQLDPGEFEWHRGNAQKAQDRFDKLIGQAEGVEQNFQARRTSATADQVREASAELAADITGWGEPLYQEIMAFGVKSGLSDADVKGVSNAKVIKLIHMAMLYDKGSKAVATKVKATPDRVLKPTRSATTNDKAASTAKSLKRLSSGEGSDADAVSVLMGRWAR